MIAELDRLHTKFVFVPTDKASNNVSIVCKKFYLQLIRDEISSPTYELSTETADEVIARHEAFLQSHGIKLSEENKTLPSLYATVKMHKNPVKFRCITAGNKSSLQQLSKALGICLKYALNVVKSDSRYNNNFYRRNDYYIIDSNNDVVDFINNCNVLGGRKSVNTYDFSTLYTSIPHQQLKDNLKKFVDMVFNIKDKSYIICNLFLNKAYFSNAASTRNVLKFSKDEFLECLFYLIDNSFIVFNGCVYRQCIGIPMGTNAGPHIANIYLFIYEHEYFVRLREVNDVDSLCKLEYIFRYQDDLLAINDFGLLGDVLSDIYPPEMVVNNTNISSCKCNFLDLTISIYRGRFLLKLYDKRVDYDFDVISYPFLDGNIPKAPSYGIFISQLSRFARNNSTFNGFILDSRNLVNKLVNQHFNVAALRNKFNVFVDRHFDVWGKFGVDLTWSHIC